MACPRCGAKNGAGSKFCSQCGAAMARTCASCATPLGPDAKFCNECGTPVDAAAAATAGPPPLGAGRPSIGVMASAERRRVSVLFADLVGFTPLSEKRDAEEVRELLTAYFDTCRALVTRYGGVVEKFIGDAVMAVWGAPVAHEDDAERAVRAALDLVGAVATLGAEIGAPGLRARAGVLTGDAAVTLGADAQGMVAGDLVNTTSRIQAEAQPGSVLVGDATHDATEAAVVYEDTGEHTLKGKADPVRLWRALRVVAMRGGALKSEGLEAPFVGRDRELRHIKDLLHACAEERKAHLVSVVGIAGIGKSRLSWEFFKYVDGIAELVYTHRGRCLAYGEGVTYWALAEMVRMRADIVEGEELASARAKLQACLATYLPDADERRWVEPRLAQLLALEDHQTPEREDLFSAWRLFFERLADQHPTVLLFEDTQWADTSLLDFIEYLLEWSRNHALYVVTLARPELVDRYPTWGAGKRNFTSVFLEPLRASAMEQLLDGLVPGLPDELREQILQRAEGVPLYAVETVRMLLDRGLLERAGSVYRLTGPVEDLAVPQSLHGLIAARLDGLRPEARRVLQDAAVLGKTFTLPALAVVSGVPGEELQPMLSELVHKEMLSLQADPRSPERGQYGFLQDLVKRVAYETLSKRDRKEKHLAVAAWFENLWTGEESDVVEVVASHYLEAYNLAPEDPDAEAVKERAADVLSRAGERAASLAANAEAERYFDQAAQLVGQARRKAEMYERAGQMAWSAGRNAVAIEHLERAIAMYEGEHLAHPAARALSRLGMVESVSGQLDQSVQRMEHAFSVLANDPPDEDLATLAVRLGSLLHFKGDAKTGAERTETALDIAEKLGLPETLSQALNVKAMFATQRRHDEEAMALFAHALKLGLDNDLPLATIRAHFNLADLLCHKDRYTEALDHYRSALTLSRKIGDRSYERSTIAELAFNLMLVGEWDEAAEFAATISEDEVRSAPTDPLSLFAFGEMYVHRGQLAEFEKLLSWGEQLADSDDWQAHTAYLSNRACLRRAQHRHSEALADAEEAMTVAAELGGPGHQNVKCGFKEACEAAFALNDPAKVDTLLGFVDGLRPGERSRYLGAQASRFRARLATANADASAVEPGFEEAERLFRQVGMVFWLAVTQSEHAEWLRASGGSPKAEPLTSEARRVFERLRATVWLDRLSQTLGTADVTTAVPVV
jgi:class 3 adenylate cyclase/tetratricopeptide (TPR) repeat protein